MSTSNNNSDRNVSVRPVERDNPELRRLARALIDLAIEQSEAVAPLGNVVSANSAGDPEDIVAIDADDDTTTERRAA